MVDAFNQAELTSLRNHWLTNESEIHWIPQQLAFACLQGSIDDQAEDDEIYQHQNRADDFCHGHPEQPCNEGDGPDDEQCGDSEIESFLAVSIYGWAFGSFPEPNDQREDMGEDGERRFFLGRHGARAECWGVFEFELDAAGGVLDGGSVHEFSCVSVV